MLHAPLVPVCLAWILGLLVGSMVPSWLTLTAAALALLAAWRWRQRGAIVIAFFTVALVGLGAARAAAQAHRPPHHVARFAHDAPQQAVVRGRVASDVLLMRTPGRAPQATAALDVTHRRTAAGWTPTIGRLRVTSLHPTPFAYGDQLILSGTLQSPRARSNPGTFDYRAYLARQDIHATLLVRPQDSMAVLRHGGPSWTALAVRVRLRARQLINRYLPPAEASLLAAFLLGDRGGVPPALEDALVRTGTMHVLAISGFNVGLLACCALLLLRMLGVPRAARLLITMAVLGLFAVIAESRAPVLRATVMAWALLGGQLLHRSSTPINALSFAALALLAWQPSQLGDPGFQLSFAAVLALIVGTPRLLALVERTRAGAWCLTRALPRAAMQLTAATLAATLGTLPIILHHFGVIAPIGLLANLIVVPLVSALLIGGLVLLLIGGWFSTASVVAGTLLALLMKLTAGVILACSTLPGRGWLVAPLPWFGVVTLYALGALAWFRREIRWPEARVAIVWCVALNVWLWARLCAPIPTTLRVTALDVGHGDAVLIEFPYRGRILIDGGSGAPFDQGRRTIVPYLQARGIRRLDAVILTHPDSDHVGGLASVLRWITIGAVIETGDEKPTDAFHAFRDAISAERVPHILAQRGDRLLGFPAATIDVLHPSHEPQLQGNDRSLVLRVRHGTRDWLFCGDADEAGLAALLRNEPSLRADVLKVPHHGSALGDVTERFFARLEPSLAMLSMTDHGRRGLPHPSTLEALDRWGVETHWTGRDGAVTIVSDGAHFTTSTHHVAQR